MVRIVPGHINMHDQSSTNYKITCLNFSLGEHVHLLIEVYCLFLAFIVSSFIIHKVPFQGM
jgi:hypothetical protein